MRFFSIALCLIELLCVTACSNQDIVDNEQITPSPTRTLKLNAVMPGEETKSSESTTRLSLTETDEGTISVKWREGDKINLCFVSNDRKVVRTVSNVAVTNISENGKQAVFEINIPDEITGTFNLYGVYGASFLSDNNSVVLFPSPSDDGPDTALGDLENICVMRFAVENITEASLPKVSFSHFGSILAVLINNKGTSPLNLNVIEMSSGVYNYLWLKNSYESATLDIATNNFVSAKPGSHLEYTPSEDVATVPAGGFIKLYRWIIPGDTIGTGNSATKFDFQTYVGPRYFKLPIYTIKLLPGKYYRLRMEWDGSNFLLIKPPVTDIDGNNYKTVTIGTQTWMAENLKVSKYNDGSVIPNVIYNKGWGSLTYGALCDYTYEPYYSNLYGKLYNWYAVNTGKLCPTGWHVPNDGDWTTLVNFLIAKGYNYDGATTGNKVAKAMASASDWKTSAFAGAVGNNDYPEKRNNSGFNAIPVGHRFDADFFLALGYSSIWWSSTIYYDYCYQWTLDFDRSDLFRIDYPKNYGFSVRCVKD